jgi:LytS/YehU family sensor histidine kinase
MERDVALARRMLADLGDLLRLALDNADAVETTFADELRFVRKYVDIQKIRFGERLCVDFQVDKGALDSRIPTLLLQPLVENAIVHGIAPRASGGTVVVRARHADARLQIRVEDDGRGLPAGWALDACKGVGLRNVRERLEQLYPNEHRFVVSPGVAAGVVVDIALPLRQAGA